MTATTAGTALIVIGMTLICYLPFSKPFPGRLPLIAAGMVAWIVGVAIVTRTDNVSLSCARCHQPIQLDDHRLADLDGNPHTCQH